MMGFCCRNGHRQLCTVCALDGLAVSTIDMGTKPPMMERTAKGDSTFTYQGKGVIQPGVF